MSPSKPRTAAAARFLRLRRGPFRWLLLAATACSLAGLACYALWQHVGPWVTGQPRYLIDVAAVEITPPPDWVPQDVKSRALREAGLSGTYSLFDPLLAERVGRAFLLHPWIRDVRVTKQPAGLLAAIEYRRPVLRVDLSDGYVLVDVDGVRLPLDSPQRQRFAALPRLTGIKSRPPGPEGTPWPNPQVTGAARIAAALMDDWSTLGLATIAAASKSFQAGSTETELFYLLPSRGQTRIIWGSVGTTSEPSPPEKVARLKSYLAQHGSFDAGAAQDLDLRPPLSLLITPRQAKIEPLNRGAAP